MKNKEYKEAFDIVLKAADNWLEQLKDRARSEEGQLQEDKLDWALDVVDYYRRNHIGKN